MFFWPLDNEIVESKLSHTEIIRRLKLAVKPVKYQSIEGKYSKQHDSVYLFNGIVDENSFAISKNINRPDNFLPLIRGRIENFDTGLCVIQLRYSLFPIVNYFFVFWALLMIILCIALLNEGREWYYGLLPILILAGTYALMMNRFFYAVSRSRKELMRLIS